MVDTSTEVPVIQPQDASGSNGNGAVKSEQSDPNPLPKWLERDPNEATEIAPPPPAPSKPTTEDLPAPPEEPISTLSMIVSQLSEANKPVEDIDLNVIFKDREDMRSQIEWDVVNHVEEYQQFLDYLFTNQQVDTTNQYFSETKVVLEQLGIKVTKTLGEPCKIELPEALKQRPKESVRTEFGDLTKGYSRVSIKTKNVFEDTPEGGKREVMKKYLVVEGSHKNFRQLHPKGGTTAADKRFVDRFQQMKDLHYEFVTNNMHDEPFYIWYEFQPGELEKIQASNGTSQEPISPHMISALEHTGITPDFFRGSNSQLTKEQFDKTFHIDKMLSKEALHQAYIHGWMGNSGVMEDLVTQASDETQQLLDESKINVAITFDTDGIHGNLAKMIPGARHGDPKMTSTDGAAQTEYILNRIFGIMQNEGGTICGWSKGGARAEELHGLFSGMGVKGWNYLDITPAKRKTCSFEGPLPEQSIIGQIGSLISRSILKTTDMMHSLGATRMPAGKKLVGGVGAVYTFLHLRGNERRVVNAANIHLENVGNPAEAEAKKAQDIGLIDYEGLSDDKKDAIQESLTNESAYAIGVAATRDELVKIGPLRRQIDEDDLGIAYMEYDGTHAIMLEQQFLAHFPLGLINASKPHELHAFQRLCEEIAFAKSKDLSAQSIELMMTDGLNTIYEGRPKFIAAAKQALPHMIDHLAYYGNRAKREKNTVDQRAVSRLESLKEKISN
jgi:hypothetical protein